MIGDMLSLLLISKLFQARVEILLSGFFSAFFRQLLATTCWYFELESILDELENFLR